MRPGQNININWKTTDEVTDLVANSCVGRIYDNNLNLISFVIPGWNNTGTQLSDNQDGASKVITITEKGDYKFKISCSRMRGTFILDDAVSNTIHVKVTQSVIQER